MTEQTPDDSQQGDGPQGTLAQIIPAGAVGDPVTIHLQAAATGNMPTQGTFSLRVNSSVDESVQYFTITTVTDPVTYVGVREVGTSACAVGDPVIQEVTERAFIAIINQIAIPLLQRGAADGVATLDSGIKIPAAQLPAVARVDGIGPGGVNPSLDFSNSDPATGLPAVIITVPDGLGGGLVYTFVAGGGLTVTDGAGLPVTQGVLREEMVITGSTNYIPPAGTSLIEAYGLGAGGGSGGCGSGWSAGNSAASGGGAAGAAAYLRYVVDPSALPTLVVVIGGGGSAGGSGSGTGGTGGDTVITDGGTTILRAKGGIGGSTMPAGSADTTVLGGTGQTSTSGDINGRGAPGGAGIRRSGTAATPGIGGSTEWGAGGQSRATHGAGTTGAGYGAGAGGALSLTAAVAGALGTSGLIIMRAYG